MFAPLSRRTSDNDRNPKGGTRHRNHTQFSAAGFVAAIILCASFLLISCGESGEAVSIESFSPQGETPQATNFTIEFSQAVVGDSVIGIEYDTLPVTFRPPVPGKYIWIATDKLRLFPDVLLLPSTEYNVEVSSKLTQAYGYRIKGESKFTLHTPKLRVVNASLLVEYIENTNKEVNLLATIEFNYPVDPVEVLKSTALRFADGRTISLKAAEDTVSSIVSLRAERVPRSESEKKLQLVIKEGFKCENCGLGLAHEFTQPLTLPGQSDLKVDAVIPIRETSERAYVRVEFSIPVQSATATRYITIQPAVSFRITGNYRYLDLIGEFDVGATYQVDIAKGLKAIDGSPLKRDFSTAVTFRQIDIPPQINFSGKGFYLTRNGNLNLGLSTINVDSASISIERVFPNNLTYLINGVDLASPYSYYNLNALGKRVSDTTINIASIKNEEVVTPFSVAKYLSKEGNGIFHFTARSTQTRWRRAQTWVLATDMGIVAKQSDAALWVWVNSLTSLQPMAGAEIRLYSQNNQLLLTGKTNDRGIAVFDDFAKRTEGFTPYLVTASSGDDFSFLEMRRRRLSTAEYDVGGLPILSEGYDAFVYNERGVYRPGETAHLAAIIRGVDQIVPTPFPLKLTVTGPDNRILDEQRVTISPDGVVAFTVDIPNYARTGKYDAVLKVGDKDEIGRASFSVEEFVPDRMKIKISTDRLDYFAGDTLDFQVDGVTLFGPPASGRRVDATVELEAFPFKPDQWKTFSFGDSRKTFSQQNFKLDQQTLDQEGRYTYTFSIPDQLDPPSSLRGIISATVLEPGGRGVTAYHAVSVHPHRTYVGLRRPEGGYAKPNEAADFDVVVVNPDGTLVPDRDLSISFYRVVWQSVLRQTSRSEGYRYVSERVEQLQKTFDIHTGSDVAKFSVTPEDYGSYLVVAQDVITGATTSMSFYASGWGYSPWAMNNPDRVKLDLDKEEYLPGETAQLQVRAPFSGKLLITVENNGVLDYQVVTLDENTANLQISVKESYKPNVYISAHLIRSTESLDRDTPVRAFGIKPLMVNTEKQRLNVEMDAPDVMLPDRDLTVNFKVTGAESGAIPVTIAAVDEGILQLTDFRTPDPHEHFLGKRRLGIETEDVYSMILPEIESKSSTGGDLEAARKRQLTPISIRRVKPVSLWSGILHTDDRGFGKATFKVPEFSGTLRLMAVASQKDRFGNGEKKVIVRRPLHMTPTFPRFLAGGDKFTVPVSVFNGTGSSSTFKVKLSVDGPVQVAGSSTQSIEIADNQEKVVYFDLQTDEAVGKVKFTLNGSGNGQESKIDVEVPIRPPVPVITLSGSGVVEQTSAASFEFPGDWVDGTTTFELSVSGFPAVRFSGSLQYLLRYPHGCLEQTVSRIFPLLYLNDLARMVEPELFQHNSADYYIEEGVVKLASMHTSTGEFDFWPNGNFINRWGTVYATHFLVEARKAGYVVPDRIYDSSLRALKGYARDYDVSTYWRYQVAIYACYVLALAGEPDRSSMNYFKDNLSDQLRDYSQYQLAGAFGLSGDMATARMLLPKSAAPLTEEEERESGGNFNSSVRARAIMLDVLAEIEPKNPMIPLLVKDLTKAATEFGRWYTTQENAFALLALGKIMRLQSGGTFSGTASIDGTPVVSFDTRGGTVSNRSWGGKQVNISINGTGACYYYWRADGLPAGKYIDEYDHDLVVRRRYLDDQGNPVDYQNLTQGELVVAKITLEAPAASVDNVAVVDLLPAGLEIENPRLQSRQVLPWIKGKSTAPQYMDFRDDRMVLYTSIKKRQTQAFYYSLRAVTVGDFILPPVRAEAMYAPMKSSVGSSSTIRVVR
jgi:uncharacterized protein YfaS (alpha-2-macroglobulin family)